MTMTRSMMFRLSVVAMVILLYPTSAPCAKDAGQVKVAVEPGLSSEVLKDEEAIKEEASISSRLDEQDRFNRLLKEYVQSYNKAESEEERNRLRRDFDEQTRAYRESLAEEQESLKKRDVEKERQTLTNEYHKNLRRLEQDHDKKVRRLELECRRDEFGVDKNGLPLEPATCKKKKLQEEEFNRRLKFLEDDYNASLRKLQRK